MNQTPHPSPQQLQSFLAGLLPPDDADRLEQHLTQCDECSQQLAAFSARNDPLVARLRGIEPQIAPRDASFRDEATLLTPAAGVLQDTDSQSAGASSHTPVDFRDDDTCFPVEGAQPAAAITAYHSTQTMGRYRIERLLGRGGFGEVYRAWDDQLRRPVAIKVTFQRFLSSEGQENYLVEAQTVASLDHSSIVPVYDVGQADNGDYFVVSKLIDGSDLSQRIKNDRLSHSEAVSIVKSIAEALHHAHSKGLVHRDVKPANILIDTQGRAFLTDFGIALREEDYGRGGGLAGTPNYMSPEQARGEGHRVDGRSDIYSLGVVLYELLTGRRPFQSSNNFELLLLISENEVKPPRQIEDRISRELERICLKALALRASDRYPTAADFAEDLRFLPEQQTLTRRARPEGTTPADETPAVNAMSTPTGPTRVVPKGLSSFDQNDADFFLDLLPGPVDRHGLPDSIRFWKQKIESKDPEQSFSVGLIYGPSGCGKSSLMKAGILPRLAPVVIPIYLEAASDTTEQRLARAIQKKLPSLAGNRNLKDTLTAIRRGQALAAGKTLLLVIDQFEQWLHGKENYRSTELTAALRQCDGQQIRCVLMVRDDFWLAVSRFMKELEIDIDASNSRLADLFDLDHAARVLGLFGKAFGKLPENSAAWSDDQKSFVKQAVAGLAQDGRVVSVRLALFAQMVRDKAWTPQTLKDIGGTSGVGVTFLEETFSSRTAQPKHRQHDVAARGVLRCLLPEHGTDIKGHMRSEQELLEASGYAAYSSRSVERELDSDPSEEQEASRQSVMNTVNPDFSDLLKILDSELRLITPTDPEGKDESGRMKEERKTGLTAIDSSFSIPPSTFAFYQLTHDYLVPSLREWLTRKQKETRKGRAELKLEERTALWTAKPENRHLPSLREWLSIRTLTNAKDWKAPQRIMMQRAGRVQGLRSVFAAVILIAAIFTLQFILLQQRATSLVAALRAAKPEELTSLVQQADENHYLLEPILRMLLEKAQAADADASDHGALLPAQLVLAGWDSSQAKSLSESFFTVDLAYLAPILTRLSQCQYASDLHSQWLEILRSPQETNIRRFRAALGLVGLEENQTPSSWTAQDLNFVAEQLVLANTELQPLLRERLKPIGPKLLNDLENISADLSRNQLDRIHSANALAIYAADRPDILTKVITRLDPKHFEPILAVLSKAPEAAIPRLRAVVTQKAWKEWNDLPVGAEWGSPPQDIHDLLRASSGELLPRFAYCHCLPLDEAETTVSKLAKCGYRLTQFRPYQSQSSLLVAAIWHRDGIEQRLLFDRTANELERINTELYGLGFVPVDVTGYLLPGERTGSLESFERYAAVWKKADLAAASQTVPFLDIKAGLSEEELGQLWSKTGGVLELTSSFSTLRFPKSPIADHHVSIAGSLWTPTTQAYCCIMNRDFNSFNAWNRRIDNASAFHMLDDVMGISLTSCEHVIGEKEEAKLALEWAKEQADASVDATALLSETIWQAAMGAEEYELAITEVSKLIDTMERELRTDNSQLISRLGYRAIAFALVGKKSEAMEDLRRLSSLLTHDMPYHCTWEAVNYACLGDEEKLAESLEKIVTVSLDLRTQVVNGDAVSNAMRYGTHLQAIALAWLLSKEPHQRSKVEDVIKQKLSTIRLGQANGSDFNDGMLNDFLSKMLSRTQSFREFAGRERLFHRYAFFRNQSASIESQIILDATSEDYERRYHALVRSGYTMVSVSCAEINGEASFASVWHRPRSSESDCEQRELARVRAAVALFRLGIVEFWPEIFEVVEDPRANAYFIEALSDYGVNPEIVVDSLQNKATTPQQQRTLLLALGSYPHSQLKDISPDSLFPVLGESKSSENSGVHSAARWLEQTLEVKSERDDDVSLPTANRRNGNRPSEVTWSTGPCGLEFAEISGGRMCLGSNSMRDPDADSDAEAPQCVTVHPFAIGTTEISDREYRLFFEELRKGMHPEIAVDIDKTPTGLDFANRSGVRLGGDESIAATGVNFTGAALFCNWLSKKAGLHEEDWCYVTAPQIGGVVEFRSESIAYRLPSTYELEFATRAGSGTRRFFGHSDALLPEYAWFKENSSGSSCPVGRKKPNPFGLFDVYGNAWEWCHGKSLRGGGCYASTQKWCRSAMARPPAYSLEAAGFRVARSLKVGETDNPEKMKME